MLSVSRFKSGILRCQRKKHAFKVYEGQSLVGIEQNTWVARVGWERIGRVHAGGIE